MQNYICIVSPIFIEGGLPQNIRQTSKKKFFKFFLGKRKKDGFGEDKAFKISLKLEGGSSSPLNKEKYLFFCT